MNWFKENKFLSGLLAVFIIAAGILIFLLLGAKDAWSEAEAQYDARMSQLTELRSRSPFRDNENLTKIQSQEQGYTDAALALQGRLFDAQRPVKPVDPSAFQGRLRESVSSAIAHAREKKVELPKGFYMGFERYEKELPRNEITGLLDWQLTAVENLVSRMIELNVAAITQINRPPLPGEFANEQASATVPLLHKYPLQIGCLSFEDRAQSLLDSIVTADEFMVIRAVRIENEQRAGPPRAAAGSEQAGAAAPDQATPGATPEPELSPTIAGTEKVKVQVLLDLVQFNSPKTVAETVGRKGPAR